VSIAECSSGGSGSGTTRLKLEKTNITVNAFPAIDSAGLYIAQDQGLFAAQGLHVTIVPVPKGPPPSTQDLIKGQVDGNWDISAGDYVTYIEDQLGADGAPRNDLRIIAEASFLQPNVLTVMVNGDSEISQVSQLKGKNVSVNAPNDIGTLLIDSLLVSHGLDQGSTQDFPIQGYAVTAAWAKKYPNTLKAFTTALSQGQQLADTNRAAVEAALQKYLGIPAQPGRVHLTACFPARR
jgi:NitT/TauT family transport system substrate-binding protein